MLSKYLHICFVLFSSILPSRPHYTCILHQDPAGGLDSGAASVRRGPWRRHRAVSLPPPPGQPVASSHARSRGSAPAAQRPRVFYPCSICTCSPCTALGRGGGARSPYSQRLVRGYQGRNSGTTGPGRAAASGSWGAGGREPRPG